MKIINTTQALLETLPADLYQEVLVNNIGISSNNHGDVVLLIADPVWQQWQDQYQIDQYHEQAPQSWVQHVEHEVAE